MADAQDRAEAADADKVGPMPPDKPPGAQAYGAAGAEPHAPESVAARAAREVPEDAGVDPDDQRPVGDPTIDEFPLEQSAVTPAEEAALHETELG